MEAVSQDIFPLAILVVLKFMIRFQMEAAHQVIIIYLLLLLLFLAAPSVNLTCLN
jgi:hypothetical protein